MLDALEYAREAAKPLLKLQHEMAEKLGKKKMEVSPKTPNADIAAAVDKAARKKLTKTVTIKDKLERYAATDELKKEIVAKLAEKFIVQDEDTTAKEARKKAESEVKDAFDSLKKKIVRGMVAKDKKRIDGRRADEIRDISIEVGLIPSAHGSALFTRGETQALVTATLGSDRDAQRVEHLEGRQEERRFMLHYNFPPFCVGEVNFRMGTGRREKGHGMLAERALVPVVPDLENTFPYTIRVVSDIMGSNGSSSMASVCGGSLAMMDAGIPVTRPTAGIAMGLIKEGDDLTVLSDILGDEDHLGDMDFKVCGTSKGITAFQLDTKIAGITKETMTAALTQAREGIDHILGEMAKALDTPRAELSENAPRITTVKIPGDCIGLVIGQGGKTIKSIQDATNTTIKIEEEGGMGVVSISSADKTSTQQVIEIIEGLTAEPEVGKVYLGTVKKIVDFGAFIEILPGKDGLCHISELTEGRVNSVHDVLREGDECMVKVLDVERGKIRLSRRAALADKATD
jgi:polyribonucleotide nucleotidyltransferase